MKKIALLHYSYPPSMGGVEILLAEQATILAKIGYDVLVLTGSGEERNPDVRLVIEPQLRSVLQQDPNLQKEIVEEGKITSGFRHLEEEIYAILKRYLADRDVIIVHNMATLVHNLPFLSALKRYHTEHAGKRLLIWVHDQTFIDEQEVRFEKKGVNLSVEQKRLLLTPLPGATYVVISHTLGRLFAEVMQMPESDLVVIQNGINLQEFYGLEDKIYQTLLETKTVSSELILFSPVNILQRKNLLYALDVVAELSKTYPSLRYLITGKPSIHRSIKDHYEELKQKVTQLNLKDQVVFLHEKVGTLSNETVKSLYSLSDAVLYLSKQENFGLAILEASLLHTPIFVSDLSVFSEVGGEGIHTITLSTSASIAANEIAQVLERSAESKLHKRVRMTYDLEQIIKTKLVPLF